MKRIFVTGGSGMTSDHLLFKLSEKGYKIKALKRESSNIEIAKKIFNYHSESGNDLFSKIEWITGDILDYDFIENAVNDVEHVYHTAAWVSFKPKDKRQMIYSNVQGTANIVNACLNKEDIKLCHCSSVAALGETGNGTELSECSEKTDYEDVSDYAISKQKSENEVWRGIAEGLDAVIVNPSVILGAGNWDHGSPRIIKTVWDGLKYYTRGENGFVDVRDVAEIMIKLTESEISNERFVLNAENLPFRSVMNMIAEALGKEKPSRHANTFMLNALKTSDHIRYYLTGKEPRLTKHLVRSTQQIHTCSSKKLIDTIGYEFIPIDQSIKDICKIFLNEIKSFN